MCLAKEEPSPCGEGILPLFIAAGKPVLSEVEGPQALGMVVNCNFAGAFVHNELGENIDEYF